MDLSYLWCGVGNGNCSWLGGSRYFFISRSNFLIPRLIASVIFIFSCSQYESIVFLSSLLMRILILLGRGLLVGLPVLGDMPSLLSFVWHNYIFMSGKSQEIFHISSLCTNLEVVFLLIKFLNDISEHDF